MAKKIDLPDVFKKDQKKKYVPFLRVTLIIFFITLFANVIYLNIVYFKKPSFFTKPSPSPEQEAEILIATPEEEYIAFCKNEVSEAIATISSQLSQVSQYTPVVQTSPTYSRLPSTTYIPLGGSVSTTKRDWSYVGGAEAYFDKGDYPGAKKITFEVFLRIKHGAGDANARLYDASHKFVISNSELKANQETFTLKTTPSLELMSGNNKYQVQLRSTTGYEAYMDQARLKVEY